MSFRSERTDWEKRYWRRLMKRSRGNLRAAAREAGVSRDTAYRMLKRLGLFAPITNRIRDPHWQRRALVHPAKELTV